MEPSWPVFIACSMSSASPPRHSPTTMRSGRIRSELMTRRWMVISPSPLMSFGRVSRRHTCSWWSCSSAASSMVTMRRALVDAPARGADDELDHVQELVFVHDLDVREDDLARHFDVHMVVAVDHDLGYTVVADERLDRPELLVVLIDVDTWDPDCHSASLRSGIGKPSANYTLTLAIETPVTGPDPAARNALAHAFRVAPVVATSSTSSIDSPSRPAPRQPNASFTFSKRRSRSRPTCGGVERVRTSSPLVAGSAMRLRSSAASSSAWLYPRSRKREGCSGTAITQRAARPLTASRSAMS